MSIKWWIMQTVSFQALTYVKHGFPATLLISGKSATLINIQNIKISYLDQIKSIPRQKLLACVRPREVNLPTSVFNNLQMKIIGFVWLNVQLLNCIFFRRSKLFSLQDTKVWNQYAPKGLTFSTHEDIFILIFAIWLVWSVLEDLIALRKLLQYHFTGCQVNLKP